jgi:ribosomal protein S18 acetylase RimI-like enzyme
VSEEQDKGWGRIDPACAMAVAALENDPFYRSICAGDVRDIVRRIALTHYFAYAIEEGRNLGRVIHLDDPTRGVAVWLLPQLPNVRSRAAQNKRLFLEATLGAVGCANYYRIVNFVTAKAANVVDDDAWYLSIVAVDPASQGRGFGRKLLAPTLAEADRVAATCYLETFSPRNFSFYERLGFVTAAQFAEPAGGFDCALMVRQARGEHRTPRLSHSANLKESLPPQNWWPPSDFRH